MPGFAVFFQAHFFGLAVRVEAEHGLGSADFDGDDVPDVERDDPSTSQALGYAKRLLRSGQAMGGDEIDVTFGVDGAAFADGVGGAGLARLLEICR